MMATAAADQSYGTVVQQRAVREQHLQQQQQPRWTSILSSFGVGFSGSGGGGGTDANMPRRRQHVRAAVCWRRLRMIMPRHRTLRSIRHVLVIVCIPLLLLLLLSVYLIDSSLGRRKSLSGLSSEERMANDGQDIRLLHSKNAGQKEYVLHGVHYVVGHFMGKGFPWEKTPNLTSDTLNANNYSPVQKYGENGQPVYVPDYERSRAKELFYVNRFNLVASDMISVNRSLPDPRRAACRLKRYDLFALPNTSVVITFHNEAWSTLLRTVHSVLNRSPRGLLHEILLVDDASERTFLGRPLAEYADRLSASGGVPIRLLRSPTRIGLIQGRILGSQAATGQVLTFLDSHVEATTGWLEPLLHRINQAPQTVISPVIDIINDQTFAYSRSFDSHWGAMNWALSFRWFSVGARELKRMRLPNYDQTATYRCPIMAGGLFAISRKYFFQLGAYDSALRIWGGENIEMSLRVWQCGGRVEIAPCSHVAHLFRSSSPYSFGEREVGEVLYINNARVAEVWMDEYKHLYYQLNPPAAQIARQNRSQVMANITERVELRRRLKCKPFSWFLDTVWPESFWPTANRRLVAIQSAVGEEEEGGGDCLQRSSALGSLNPTGKVVTGKCATASLLFSPQLFTVPPADTDGYIMSDESVCLDVNSSAERSSVLLIACAEFDRQRWRYQSASRQLLHVKSSLCVTLDKGGTFLALRKCRLSSRRQKWNIHVKQWKKEKNENENEKPSGDEGEDD